MKASPHKLTASSANASATGAAGVEDESSSSAAEEVPGLDGATDSGDESGTRKRKRSSKPEASAFVSPGFTSINRTTAASVPSSASDDEFHTPAPPGGPRKPVSSTGASGSKRMLVPVIPRVQLDSEDEAKILDFTAGGDVVRRVKKESRGRGGELQYRVEFEDRHVEEVCPCLVHFSFKLPCRNFHQAYWDRLHIFAHVKKTDLAASSTTTNRILHNKRQLLLSPNCFSSLGIQLF